MKKYLLFSIILISSVFVSSCGKSNPKPISEVIRKVWTANTVKENATTVYTKGATGNIKDSYSYFKLDLSSTAQQTVRLTTIDQTTFVGNWTISSDNSKLTLTNLQPVPTGTTGTIEFTFDGAPTETQLNLTRTSPDAKTGNTTNKYQLVNP
ncbi:hypothetical protein [Siphonobacter sp. SORGH_AS_0500]|uniref:hypothetical protein n=1 Tax=Siphonobacter sp. SORGH_AS_0500 TaxID=1864824 RepID=UPI0028581174|nr:hypothetical protein [Siphonobacter sp. SORGH_AS_0500]MDR6197089.1 hypothetical protein [Siphonobacter sp. SORGH_AS_0500]